MIKLAEGWKEYAVLKTGGGYKLERWGEIVLLRPDPQVIWDASGDLFAYPDLSAVYRRSFKVKPMGFKHTGLFPEQAVHWVRTGKLIQDAVKSGRKPKILNLFAYTGAASVAMAKAGAEVVHVDASKGMSARGRMRGFRTFQAGSDTSWTTARSSY